MLRKPCPASPRLRSPLEGGWSIGAGSKISRAPSDSPASELVLEEPPPFASFSRHSPPEMWETQHTRLIDGRRVDLILSKLRDLADYHEKRNKLQPPRKTEPSAPQPASKPRPAPKKKGEGKGKSKEEDKPPANPESG